MAQMNRFVVVDPEWGQRKALTRSHSSRALGQLPRSLRQTTRTFQWWTAFSRQTLCIQHLELSIEVREKNYAVEVAIKSSVHHQLTPLLPSWPPKTCHSPSWTTGSPSSVSGWNGENAVLAALLQTSLTPTLRRKRDAQSLPSLATHVGYKKIRTVLPSIFVQSAVASPVVSVTTSSEGENSDVDDASSSPKTPCSHKKKTRLCKEKGCTSLAVSRRSCVRHGGGSRCTFEGCTNGAKLRNRCFQHGGSTICLTAGCNSKAKRYGYCWSHGGGRICSHDGCVKVAAQGGSCWAHGGGNRCRLEGCSKRSYQKYGYYCKSHAAYNI
ncbi:hypothetical protein BBO99_00009288 [Phytophthora kernoviae]|uniref:WRKY19-like zinc finger domain-containing protein n=2 Tax=Phytophthora kernoviae TaxID=325452 RepID=A0A3R7KEU3_9STRA|nr:hypothetical protein G195_010865 [Phytophthora kernoviae 00238/432]KAG2506176.1 hypothetical protein JM16_009112 [Phytophthora kernoviae]KAG2508558.1 hypothetical protein JM18_009128 [Phytophthora kernoviae]RLN06169.1 hypothetical protein BBI17_009259 [Phytophthora kernoviae]RLN73717.1 hypothetical protein BBO99_00009288 [Phytophthora kernoviae]